MRESSAFDHAGTWYQALKAALYVRFRRGYDFGRSCVLPLFSALLPLLLICSASRDNFILGLKRVQRCGHQGYLFLEIL